MTTEKTVSNISESDLNADQKGKLSSVADEYAVQIVFLCNMNQACVIWQSIFDQQLEISPEITRKLGSLIQRALSMMNECDKLHQSLHLHCASSIGFLRIIAQIAVDVLLGKLLYQLHEEALHMLELLKECNVIAYSLIRKSLISNGSIKWFTSLKNIEAGSNVVQNPNEVENVAQNVVLSLLFQYVVSKEAIEVCEVDQCWPLVNTFQRSVIPSISIRAKAIITVLRRTSSQCGISNCIELTSAELEFIAECLFEIAASKLQGYMSFSSREILQVYKEIIASDSTNVQVFEAFNVLSDEDFMDVEVSTQLHTMQLESAAVGRETKITGIVSNCLLDGFKSPIMDDADGTLWFITTLLTQINDLIKSAGKNYGVMDFQSVNIIKTTLPFIMELLSHPFGDNQQERIANHIALDKELMGTLLLILQGHGRFSVPPFGILIALTLEVVLVQCATYSKKFCFEFSKAGGLRCLQLMLHKASNEELNKFTENIITGHLAILFKCIYENPEGMLPMLSGVLYLKTIIQFFDTPCMSIQICSKTVSSLVLVIMDDTVKACLKLKADEASHLIELLCIAGEKGEASEGLLTYTVVELLDSLTNLSSLSVNKGLITEAGIIEPLKSLILNDVYSVQVKSLQLLWTLLSGSSFSNYLITDHLDLRFMLQFIHQNPSIILSLFAQCALKTLYWDTPEDVRSWFLYAHASSICGRFDDCISWSYLILNHFSESQDPLVSDCKLLLGKNLAKKYSQEQRQLEMQMDYFSAADVKMNEAVKCCYEKAKNAIMQLGYCLDNGTLDEEGSILFDFALLDYAREVNGLNKCNRCVLCRRWRKLHRSHICPESILKDIAKANFQENIRFHVTSMTSKHEVRTPRSENKWLLCGACEQLLSQHGEVQFVEKFFRLLYPTIKSTSIRYDKELYNFCIGIAFRALCLTNFSYLHNKSEIHSFFVACRDHLTTLTKNQGSLSLTKPEFFIFCNPIGLYSTEGVREDILSGILHSHFQVHISPHHLQSGERSPISQGCFLLVILGGITIVSKFSPDQTFELPHSFIPVSTEGGEYTVPSEAQRWMNIPPGVMEIFKDSVLTIQSRISQVFWGKLPLANKHKSTQIPPSWDTEIVQHTNPTLPDALKKLQQDVLSGIMQDALTVINLLPEGFTVSKTPPFSSVSLPTGHAVLKHVHRKERNVTLFLAADCYCTYVIVVQRRNQREITYGFYLQENKEQYTIKNLMVTSSVEGAETAFLQGPVAAIIDLLESLWSEFSCYKEILHHSVITRISKGLTSVSLDRKCSDDGCWYCKDLCHNCMKPAVYGYTIMVAGLVYKHCSEHCKLLHFGSPPEVPFQADLVLKVNKPLSDVVLLHITEVVTTEIAANTNTILSIQLCLSYDHPKIPNSVPYALVQIRTIIKSIFLSFLLLPDMSLGEPLYMDCVHNMLETTENIQMSSFLQEALLLALVKNDIPDLASLLTNYRSFLQQ